MNPDEVFVTSSFNEEKIKSINNIKEPLVIINTKNDNNKKVIISNLITDRSQIFDLANIKLEEKNNDIQKYRNTHLPPEIGVRKVECLLETGKCGANYGLDLILNGNENVEPKEALVLGYGNVAFGALLALQKRGVGMIRVMTRRDLTQIRLKPWYQRADIIVSAAEQDVQSRGKNFYITKNNMKNDMKKKTAVIDLIGGTPNNRCPVEILEKTTFLPDIHFIYEGIYVAGMWGWDLVGAVKYSANRYSSQVTNILIGKEQLVKGLLNLSPGVIPALKLGPYLSEKNSDQ